MFQKFGFFGENWGKSFSLSFFFDEHHLWRFQLNRFRFEWAKIKANLFFFHWPQLPKGVVHFSPLQFNR